MRPPGRSRQRHRPRPADSEKPLQAPAGSAGNYAKQTPGVQQADGSGRPILGGQAESARLPVPRGGWTEQAKGPGVVRPESAFQALARNGGVVVVGVFGGQRNEAAHLVERVLQKQVRALLYGSSLLRLFARKEPSILPGPLSLAALNSFLGSSEVGAREQDGQTCLVSIRL